MQEQGKLKSLCWIWQLLQQRDMNESVGPTSRFAVKCTLLYIIYIVFGSIEIRWLDSIKGALGEKVTGWWGQNWLHLKISDNCSCCSLYYEKFSRDVTHLPFLCSCLNWSISCSVPICPTLSRCRLSWSGPYPFVLSYPVLMFTVPSRSTLIPGLSVLHDQCRNLTFSLGWVGAVLNCSLFATYDH